MKRNGNAERQRRENRGAEGGGYRSKKGAMPPLHIFLFFWLAMMHFGVFWAIVYKAYRLKVKTKSRSSFVYQYIG